MAARTRAALRIAMLAKPRSPRIAADGVVGHAYLPDCALSSQREHVAPCCGTASATIRRSRLASLEHAVGSRRSYRRDHARCERATAPFGDAMSR